MPFTSSNRTTGISARKVMLHVACWLLFIGFELFYLVLYQGYLERWYNYAVFYLLNAALFYGQLWLMSADFRPVRFALLLRLAAFAALIISYALLKLLANHYFSEKPQTIAGQLAQWRIFLLSTLVRGGYFMVLAGFYWTAGHLADYARRLSDARNAHLQQQLQPHLLLNALNFIYNQVHQQSPAAAQQVYLLSELMRFGLSPAGPDGKVALSDELEQVNHLIEINRHRFQHQLSLLTSFPAHAQDYRLIPLILLTLTENMFKHGHLTDESQPGILKITVDAAGRSLHYYCWNLKKRAGRSAAEDSIGLRNIRLRLNLAYPKRHCLNIQEKATTFELTLTLPL